MRREYMRYASRRVVFPLATGVALALAGCKTPPSATQFNVGNNAAINAAGNAAPAPAVSVSDVSKAPPYQGKDILIGEYGDLSGGTASFGTSSRDGIAMAVDEANKSGGVLGKQIRVQLEDDTGKPEQAATVVKKLV